MGTDIHGCIETLQHDRWYAQNSLLGLVGRSYESFSVLFGVRQFVPFDPVAPDRGLPDEMSRRLEERVDEYRDHYTGDNLIGTISFHSPSWVTYAELKEVDWDKEAEELDTRYSVLDENKEPTGYKFAGAKRHDERIEANREKIDNGEPVEFENGDGETRYLQRRRPTRSEALSGAWEWTLFDLMESYADRFGEENVRLVVWFDN